MFGLPRVLSALISGGSAVSSKAAPPRAASPGPSAQPASPSAASAAVGGMASHPLLGSRLLNVGPNASPSVLAAALVASRDSTSPQPSWVMQATAAAQQGAAAHSSSSSSSSHSAWGGEQAPQRGRAAAALYGAGGTATRSVLPPAAAFGLGGKGGKGGGGDGTALSSPPGAGACVRVRAFRGGSAAGRRGGAAIESEEGWRRDDAGMAAGSRGGGEDGNGTNGNGASAAGGGMISTAELNRMLSGLRTSLDSIQESRAQYVQLLAERDAEVAELQAQLALRDQQIGDLGERGGEGGRGVGRMGVVPADWRSG